MADEPRHATRLVIVLLGIVAVSLWSMDALTLALLVSTAALIGCGRELRISAKRVHASLLLGAAIAWILIPLTVRDLRSEPLSVYSSYNPTGVPGCQVMALAGFPIQRIGAHGGGGWRLGHHLPADHLWHACNVALLAAAVWLALGWWPRRARWIVHLMALVAIVPAHWFGLSNMAHWWD